MPLFRSFDLGLLAKKLSDSPSGKTMTLPCLTGT
jgi:hypothetical protein